MKTKEKNPSINQIRVFLGSVSLNFLHFNISTLFFFRRIFFFYTSPKQINSSHHKEKAITTIKTRANGYLKNGKRMNVNLKI